MLSYGWISFQISFVFLEGVNSGSHKGLSDHPPVPLVFVPHPLVWVLVLRSLCFRCYMTLMLWWIFIPIWINGAIPATSQRNDSHFRRIFFWWLVVTFFTVWVFSQIKIIVANLLTLCESLSRSELWFFDISWTFWEQKT